MDLARAHHAGFELVLENVHVPQLLTDALGDLQPNALKTRAPKGPYS